jgi:hypothetical protein
MPSWSASSKGSWVSPGTTLQVPVPHSGEGGFLLIDFEVLDGTDIDFDVMFEDEDEIAVRLYGPTRRARQVKAAVPLPSSGVAYATFDNFGSWFTKKRVRYSLQLAHRPPDGHQNSSSLRFNKGVTPAPPEAPPEMEAEVDDPLDYIGEGQPSAPIKTLLVSPGSHEDVPVDVAAGARLLVSMEVVSGRDIDFAISLETENGPIRVFGPCRRSTKLLCNVVVPQAGRVHMGFDSTGTWFKTKEVKYAYQVLNDESI